MARERKDSRGRWSDLRGSARSLALVRDLAASGFIAQRRNIVPVGGTGTGKTHLAIAIARSCSSWRCIFMLTHAEGYRVIDGVALSYRELEGLEWAAEG